MFQPKILTYNDSSLTVYPDRGGIITSIKLKGIELLYQRMLDETLHDMTKSVRGGIPILFPNAGFLTDEQKSDTGWNLPQHGFARINEWNILSASHHSLTQSLSSSDLPDMFGYEWQGTIENTITISDEGVELRYSIANNSDNGIPLSWGLHPYWDIPLGDKSRIEWNFVGGDTIASDIENWSTGGITRIDVPDDGVVSFTIPSVGSIELSIPSEFRRLWIWSLPDQNFVCVEPVMGDDGHIVKNPCIISGEDSMLFLLKILFRK